MEWPISTLRLFEDEMEVLEAEERIKRIADAQMAGGHVDKQTFNRMKERLEKAARGRQKRAQIKKVDPRSPEGRQYMASFGMPFELVDKQGRPIDLG